MDDPDYDVEHDDSLGAKFRFHKTIFAPSALHFSVSTVLFCVMHDFYMPMPLDVLWKRCFCEPKKLNPILMF